MSMAWRSLKSPLSLSGTSIPPNMVTKVTLMVSLNDQLTSLSFYVNRPSHSYFKLWPWNLKKVKVMGVVKGQGLIVSPVSNWFAFFSFHINLTNNSWDTAISKYDLEKIQDQIHGWGLRLRSHNSSAIPGCYPTDALPFCSHQLDQSFLRQEQHFFKYKYFF